MLRSPRNPWLNEMTFGVTIITDQQLFNVATPLSQAKRPRLCDSLQGTNILVHTYTAQPCQYVERDIHG